MGYRAHAHVINLLNRVPEHDSLFSCNTERNVKQWILNGSVSTGGNSNPNPNPIQNALVYISFCVARKKSENRALGHDSIDE